MMCTCTVCTEKKSENIRTRPSVLVHIDQQAFLIDLSQDFRQQFLRENRESIPTTVFFTHAHNDHIAGLGAYADLCFWQKTNAALISPPDILETILVNYEYLRKKHVLHFISQDFWQINGWEVTFHKAHHAQNRFFHMG